MPVLAWESGYVELKCPGKLNIGRGPTNEYQPESQSVSKLHAILELVIGNGGKIDCFLEDLNSRNGTFIGPEPGDMEKLTIAMGRRKIKYGDYIRFGNANSFHRYLEYPPADLETARVEIKEQPSPIADTIIPATREVSSDPLHNNDLFRNDHNMAIMPAPMYPPPRHQGPSPQNSNSNMTVSVNYPTMQMAPVSVTIDPGLINNQAAAGGYGMGAPMMGAPMMGGYPGYGYHGMPGGYQMGMGGVNPRGYPGMPGSNFDPYAAGMPYMPQPGQFQAPPPHQPNPSPVVNKPDFEIINPSPISKGGDDYGRNNRYDNIIDYPPLEHSNWDPQHEGRRRSKDSFLDDAIAMLQNDKPNRKKHLSSIPESPRKLGQSLNSLNSLYAANKVYRPPIKGEVVNLLLPSTPDVALVVKEIIGAEIETEHEDDMIKMARAYDKSKVKKGKKKEQPEIPPNIATEILVEDMCEENTTVLYHFNSAMSELNDLLKRSYAGMQLDPKGLQTSAEFDILLQGLTNSMLEGSIKALQNVRNSNLVTAFSVAQKSGFKNYVEPIITTSAVRLVRLLAFESNEFLASESHSLNQYEMYEVAAFVLNKVVAELDLAGGYMYKTTAEVLGLPPIIDSKVSAELEELRKLKALQKGKGVEEIEELTADEKARKFVDGLCLWLVRRRFKFWRKKAEILRIAALRHTKIKKFYRSMRQAMTRCLIKPFHKWLRYASKAGAMSNSDMEIARLRNDLYAATTRMHELERKDEVASLLTAERAFNRELSAANREMRASILDLENKLLECASGPINMRKMLVRDVLLKREEEVAFARREARSLKEELNQLYQAIGTPALEENKNNRVFVKKIPSQVTPISPERGNAPEPNHNHMALQEYLRKVAKEKKDPGSHPVFHEGMSRVIAKLVVLNEVRRMRVAYKKLFDEKNELKSKLVDSTLRNTQLTESLQILQMRLSRREISQGALRTLLLQRLGDKGIAELIDSLEDLGAGKDCLLKDTVPLQLQQVDTDNEDENPEITRDDDMYFEEIEDDENIDNNNGRLGNQTPRMKLSKPTAYQNAVNNGIYGNELNDSML